MRKLIFILLTLISIQSFSQGGWLRNNTSFGSRQYRGSDDSTRFIPTGITPSLRLGTGGASANLHQGAIFMDSTNHKFWVYDPKRNAWDSLHMGASGGASNLDAVLLLGGNLTTSPYTTGIGNSSSWNLFGTDTHNYDVNFLSDGFEIVSNGYTPTHTNKIYIQNGQIGLRRDFASGNRVAYFPDSTHTGEDTLFTHRDFRELISSYTPPLADVLTVGNDAGTQDITGVQELDASTVVVGTASESTSMEDWYFKFRKLKTATAFVDQWFIVGPDSNKTTSSTNNYYDSLPRASGTIALQSWVATQIPTALTFNSPLRLTSTTVSADTSKAFSPALTTQARAKQLIDSLKAVWTISGVTLGGNLFSLTPGNGFIGSAFNGSANLTWRLDSLNYATLKAVQKKIDSLAALSSGGQMSGQQIEDSLNTKASIAFGVPFTVTNTFESQGGAAHDATIRNTTAHIVELGDPDANSNGTYTKLNDDLQTAELNYPNGVSIIGPVTATNLTSGTYTPTITNLTNITSSTARNCTYVRVGNNVTVFGSVDLTTTLAVASTVGISLPITSDITDRHDLNGLGNASTAIATNGAISGDTGNDRAELNFIGLAIGGTGTIFFSFSYTIQ